MVAITDKAAARLPFLFRYLSEVLPLIGSKPKLFKPLFDYSAFEDESAARRALQFGVGPLLTFATGASIGCNFGVTPSVDGSAPKTKGKPLLGMKYGLTASAEGTVIAYELAAQANEGFSHIFSKETSEASAWHRMVTQVFEATVLHEMIHWSFYRRYGKSGSDVEKQHWAGDQEGGTVRFEKAAYGRIQSLDWHAICVEELNTIFCGWILAEEGGKLVVKEVLQYQPAYQAGVETGDEITSIHGKAVKLEADLDDALASVRLGQTIPLVIRRASVLKNLSLNFVRDKHAAAKASYK